MAEELRKRSAEVRSMIAEEEAALAADQDNFAYKLSLISLKQHLADLLSQTGVALLNSGNLADAERELKKAIELKPATRGVFLNSILSNGGEDWATVIPFLRMLIRIDPTYENARNNLAIAFLNLGVEIAKKGKLEEGSINDANEHFYLALGATTDPEILSHIRKNFAASYTKLGTYFHEKGDVSTMLGWMKHACEVFPDETTRRNLGVAYGHLSRALMNEHRFQAAIGQIENAADAGIVIPELLNDYGVALAGVGRLSEAKLAFERTLEMDPENKAAQENLSVITSRETTVVAPRSETADETEPVEGKHDEDEWDDLISVDDLRIGEMFPDFIPIQPIAYQYQMATG